MNIADNALKIGIDTATLLHLYDLFIDHTAADIEEIKSAVKQNNRDKIKQSAHSIKGASFNLELEDIGNVAKELEMRSGEEDLNLLISRVTVLENLFTGFKKELYRKSRILPD